MHVPDAAVSPSTCLAAAVVMAPVWSVAARKLRASLSTRQVPLLSIGAAFCFTIMMFNIPAPGGTTVHPVGAGLLTVLLGPWASIIGVTVALAIQALFFGDGGVLAFGVNCFTMAFGMSVAAYVVYALAAGKSRPTSRRRAAAAGLGAYAGLMVAALLTAIVLGMQPALFHDAAGHALYSPFRLSVTLPAILLPHLFIGGVAEALVTAFAVRALQRMGLSLYGQEKGAKAPAGPGRGRTDLGWAMLGLLVVLSPLGLLARGEAWGEWGTAEVTRRVGYAPAGFAAAERHGWTGFNLLPDYLSASGPWTYVFAAAVGVLLITAFCRLLALIPRAATTAARLFVGRSRRTTSGVEELATRSEMSAPGALPAWMLNAEPAGNELDPPRRRRLRAPFGGWRLERTLKEMAERTRQEIFAEEWARQDGLLQRLDARAKLLSALALIAAVSTARHIAPVLLLAGLVAVGAVASRVPVRALALRLSAPLLLFVCAVALPAASNIVTPGAALLRLSHSPDLSFTAPGVELAALLTARVAVSLVIALLLTLTTRWQDLLRALRVLGTPRLFLTVLAMTYRYLSVLTQSAEEHLVARQSRTVGRGTSREGRGYLGAAMAGLFGRSVALTEEVHSAMVSRGWTGDARTLQPAAMDRFSVTWSACACIAAIGTVWMERLLP